MTIAQKEPQMTPDALQRTPPSDKQDERKSKKEVDAFIKRSTFFKYAILHFFERLKFC